MTIAFTLCSNNYLAHAKSLGDSVLKFNPDYRFVIGLVDKKSPEINYDEFKNFEIITFDELGCSSFPRMIAQYNIIEFNTAVKPFYFEYLFKKYESAKNIYYIDPDIICFDSFDELDKRLKNSNMLLTPHVLTPSVSPIAFDTIILRVGTYNLGFLGLRNSDETQLFLSWWQERLKKMCVIDYYKGLFVDQKWINMVPVLFKEVDIVRSPGYNMACWNFYERKLQPCGDKLCVNTAEFPLVFFHFSGFNPKDIEYFCKIRTPEFKLDHRPDIAPLFHDYVELLRANGYEKYSAIKPLLQFGAEKYSYKQKVGQYVKYKTNTLIKRVFKV